MAAIPLAIGAATAVAGGIASAAGVGKNGAKTKSFGESDQFDPQAGMYGGRPGGAEQASNQYTNMASFAGDRRIDFSKADQFGGQANTAAGLMMGRAQGAVPSIAEQQAAIQSQQAMAQQASLAAGARGAGGLALAGQQASTGMANAQSAISQQAQVNAAQERMQAEQAAYGAFSGLQNQASQQTQFTTQANDQKQLGLLAGQRQIEADAMQGRLQQQGMLAGSHDQNQARYQARMQGNADTGMKFFQGGVGAIQGGASGAMGGGK